SASTALWNCYTTCPRTIKRASSISWIRCAVCSNGEPCGRPCRTPLALVCTFRVGTGNGKPTPFPCFIYPRCSCPGTSLWLWFPHLAWSADGPSVTRTGLIMKLLPRLLITMGDVAGIGPEIIAKAWPALTAVCRPVVVGDPAWLRWALDLVQVRGLV